MVSNRFGSKKLALAFVAVALLAALVPASAYASSLGAGALESGDLGNTLTTQATKKTLKPIYMNDSLAAQKKKAALIKKRGTYALTLKNGMGIIRFKSPKTKTYSFTFSKLKSSKANSLVCVAGFCKVSSSNYSFKTIKTNEGKRPRAPFVSANVADGKSVTFDGYSYQRLAKRTAKIKVKKGSSIYIALQARNIDNDAIRSTMQLKIS